MISFLLNRWSKTQLFVTGLDFVFDVGRGRISTHGRKSGKKAIPTNSDEDEDDDDDNDDSDEEEERPRKLSKTKKLSAGKNSPAKGKLLAVPPKKKIVRRKKSLLYAENEEDFQRQLARAIRESKKEQLKK